MKKIKQSLIKLDKWLEMNGWNGYDPYDVKATKIYSFSQKNKYINYGLEKLISTFPLASRKILNVKPNLYPLVPFHLAHGYLNIYEFTGNEKYADNAKSCLSWLETNSWAEPFDWQSRIFIPKGTPDAYNIVNICNLFLRAYQLFNEVKYLNIVKDSCNFLKNKLNIDEISTDEVCFSYTPLDNFHVHNVNLYVASLLYKMGNKMGNQEYINLAKRAINYTINCQNPDGSWNYWGPPDIMSNNIDNYHTAFLLHSFVEIHRINPNEILLEVIEKGYNFYIENLFYDKKIPKAGNDHLFPVDIHACAHSILVLSEISDFYPGSVKIADNVVCWTTTNMQDPTGYFFYRMYRKNKIDKMPYVRWGEAPMLNALSKFLMIKYKRADPYVH